MMNGWIEPDWPAPPAVRAISTTRSGGVSGDPWRSLNLGMASGDDPDRVRRNRAVLEAELPAPVQWLRQVHGKRVFVHQGKPGDRPEADAAVTFERRRVCAVLTADCLPVFFCSRSGDRVGVAHAGWRGLAGGVLEAVIESLQLAPAELLAWMGPAIGPSAYEVGSELAARFPREFPGGFKRQGSKYLMDLYALARMKLESAGVRSVSGGGFCTHGDPDRFFSYRRDGVTGRMASLIWLDDPERLLKAQ